MHTQSGKTRYTQQSMLAPDIASAFSESAEVVIAPGNCLDTLTELPRSSMQLIITSPPYNIGKAYERATELETYLEALSPVVDQLVRVLSPRGSLCWQVGNFVEDAEVFPLDIFYYPFFRRHGLKLRNRVIWHFAHGLHASRRLSGRYEVLLWFTKGDTYTFTLDEIRVPSKYPGRVAA